MPRKALRCTAEVNLHAVTCPGTWLPRREDIYLSINLFGQVRRTQLTTPVFPLLFHEKFRFDKVFYTAFEPSQVADALENDLVMIEVIQLSDSYSGGKLLASYESTARDFLYPYPSYSPTYGTQDRDVLLERSLHFPGISPKLEFSTKTSIRETTSTVDPLYASEEEDLLYSTRVGRSSLRSRRSRSRPRSLSPSVRRRLEELNLDDTYANGIDDETRPPFVVRKVDSGKLIGRVPGHRRRRQRSLSPSRRIRRSSGRYSNYLDDNIYDYRPGSYSRQVTREPTAYDDSYLYRGRSGCYDDDYLGYNSNNDTYGSSSYYTPLSRTRPYYSANYGGGGARSSLRDRFDDGLYGTDTISNRVDRALQRNRSLERLDRLTSPALPYYSTYGRY